jgi:hypothetical protein
MSISVVLPLHPDEHREGHRAVLTVVETNGPGRKREEDAYQRLGATFRATPLLRVLGTAPQRLIVVGQLRLSVSATESVIEVGVESVWSEEHAWQVKDQPDLIGSLAPSLMPTAHVFPATDEQSIVTTMAKAAAEASRNAVADLRDIRYEVESALASHLRRDGEGSVLPILSTLLELSIVTNRARDQARAAAREGFWLWLTDDEAYQRHRTKLDPTLLNGHQPADLHTRPWMRTHDAGVRQCLAMDRQLSEEAAFIAGMLYEASTVAAARESEAQETFNALTAVAALGLGIPALVLAYYGADRLLPLDDWRRAGAMLPIALAAVAAGLVAQRRLPARHVNRRQKLQVVLAVASLIVLLALAGLLAPAVGR